VRPRVTKIMISYRNADQFWLSRNGRDCMSDSPHRSFERIKRDDLDRLAQIALDDFAALWQRKKRLSVYADRLRLICLCQGAAQHYVHGDRGVQDFDLWGFFQEVSGRQFPPRRPATHDFGPSRFGRNPDDGPKYKGRRVDVMGRSISIPTSTPPIESVRRYFEAKRTDSARLLAERPVIVVWPLEERGRIIWDGSIP
jgi:hypothetical protein